MDDQALIRTYGNTDLPDGTPDRPLVTFALFAYNQEKYIREAVEGAFSQTYSPLEIILSDDCSTDRTFEIMEEMAREYKGLHKVVARRQRENSGLFKHFISVFAIANGAITVVAAGDDYSLPERADQVFKALNNNPNFAAACSSVERIDKDSTPLGTYSPPLMERIGFLYGPMDHILGCSAAYITKYVKEISKFAADDIAEDAFLSHILQIQGFRIFRIKAPLVRYRIAENNQSIIKSASLKYSDYLSAEHRKRRRLTLNYNTYLSIEQYSHLIDVSLRKRPLDRNRLLHHLKRISSMLRPYSPGAAFDLGFLMSAIGDLEILKFVLPRIFGLRFSYFLFLILGTIKSATRLGRT